MGFLMLSKNFEAASTEADIYQRWETSGLFKADPTSTKKPYTLMMPPPNVTGTLHLGHALTYTLQDILIRAKRLAGFDVLWQPGTDHAGIATQIVVERQLQEKGLTRQELGRDAFLERVWEWKEISGNIIVTQQKRLGISPDWDRARFTMDEGLSHAVRKVFVQLYQDGLIYKDKRLVNWDSKLKTALSDLEVTHKEIAENFWHIFYPLADDPSQGIEIATTRPETFLGDTAVAVHPDDERYQHLVGKMVQLPLTGRLIPIIADPHCDPETGTGAVKITPAHDFNDFDMGKRHNLPMLNILTAEGILNENVPLAYQGLSCEEARALLLKELEEKGFLRETVPLVHRVPFSERTGIRIQPWLTDQWYVDAQKLSIPALEAVKSGETQFVPFHWQSTYFEWLNNIQPWCISRQLWWGHQIPAWYGPDRHIFVAETEEEAHKQANSHYGQGVELVQDGDVLDTWFSAALWPFSTLGWPDAEAPEVLARYYPTDVLVTGFDIIFFWVARMMMMGIYFQKQIPFKTVYIHALVRDEKGQKMSKSKGNILDPLELIDQYGADALRLTLAALAVPGRDVLLSDARLSGYRNFITKLWNAARFLEMNSCAYDPDFDPLTAKSAVNQWIFEGLMATKEKVEGALDAYRFDEVVSHLYKFVWGTFCDYYLEFLKPLLNGEDLPLAQETRAMAAWILTRILYVMHPITPFITEKLWQEFVGSGLLMGQKGDLFPQRISNEKTQKACQVMDRIVLLIDEVRSARSFFQIPPSHKAKLYYEKDLDEALQSGFRENASYFLNLARLESISEYEGVLTQGVVSLLVEEKTFFLDLQGALSEDRQKEMVEKETKEALKILQEGEKKLNNEGFRKNAKEEVVAEIEERVNLAQLKLKKLQAMNVS